MGSRNETNSRIVSRCLTTSFFRFHTKMLFILSVSPKCGNGRKKNVREKQKFYGTTPCWSQFKFSFSLFMASLSYFSLSSQNKVMWWTLKMNSELSKEWRFGRNVPTLWLSLDTTDKHLYGHITCDFSIKQTFMLFWNVYGL